MVTQQVGARYKHQAVETPVHPFDPGIGSALSTNPHHYYLLTLSYRCCQMILASLPPPDLLNASAIDVTVMMPPPNMAGTLASFIRS